MCRCTYEVLHDNCTLHFTSTLEGAIVKVVSPNSIMNSCPFYSLVIFLVSVLVEPSEHC